jgi:hypothetical protein
MVSIDEIILGVNIVLGNQPASTCLYLDGNRDGEITVEDIFGAVSTALGSSVPFAFRAI